MGVIPRVCCMVLWAWCGLFLTAAVDTFLPHPAVCLPVSLPSPPALHAPAGDFPVHSVLVYGSHHLFRSWSSRDAKAGSAFPSHRSRCRGSWRCPLRRQWGALFPVGGAIRGACIPEKSFAESPWQFASKKPCRKAIFAPKDLLGRFSKQINSVSRLNSTQQLL